MWSTTKSPQRPKKKKSKKKKGDKGDTDEDSDSDEGVEKKDEWGDMREKLLNEKDLRLHEKEKNTNDLFKALQESLQRVAQGGQKAEQKVDDDTNKETKENKKVGQNECPHLCSGPSPGGALNEGRVLIKLVDFAPSANDKQADNMGQQAQELLEQPRQEVPALAGLCCRLAYR